MLLWVNRRANSPEDEDEEDEQGEEDSDVVHGAQHHEQLAAQVWHEADQLEDAEQPEGPQHGQTGATAAGPIAHERLAYFDGAARVNPKGLKPI